MTSRRPDTFQVWNFIDTVPTSTQVRPNWHSLAARAGQGRLKQGRAGQQSAALTLAARAQSTPGHFRDHGYITLGAGKTFHQANGAWSASRSLRIRPWAIVSVATSMVDAHHGVLVCWCTGTPRSTGPSRTSRTFRTRPASARMAARAAGTASRPTKRSTVSGCAMWARVCALLFRCHIFIAIAKTPVATADYHLRLTAMDYLGYGAPPFIPCLHTSASPGLNRRRAVRFFRSREQVQSHRPAVLRHGWLPQAACTVAGPAADVRPL